MMAFLKVFLVAALWATLAAEKPEDEGQGYSTEVSVVVNGERAEIFRNSSETPLPKADRGSVRYSSGGAERGPGVQKPLLYGRKFEVAEGEGRNRFKNGENKDELISPIIINPIRTFSSKRKSELLRKSEKDGEILRKNQNEIFSSIQNFLSEYKNAETVNEEARKDTNEGPIATKEITQETVGRTYFSENSEEVDNHRDESKEPELEDSGGSRDRQGSDRSLMVVLPFHATEETVENFFTKKPDVKLIETPDDLEKGTEDMVNSVSSKKNDIPSVSKTENSVKENVPKKEWQPTETYKITTDLYSTTVESRDDIKTYTNDNNVKMATKNVESFSLSTKKYTNHKLEFNRKSPHPLLKDLRNESKGVKESMEFLRSTTESLSPVSNKMKPKQKDQIRKTTTEGSPKPEDLSKIMDILPADMKDLLLKIGLNKTKEESESPEDNIQLAKVPHPLIDPKSFSVFKPLPLEEKSKNWNAVSDDMKEFLASFGLMTSGRRVQKSLKSEPSTKPVENISNVDLEFLPNDLKAVLEDMGLAKISNIKEPTKIHIFNPNNHTTAQSDEDLEKINAILASIMTAVNDSQSLTSKSQNEIIEKIKDLNNLRYKTVNISEINKEIQKGVVSNNSRSHKPSKRATRFSNGPDPLVLSEEIAFHNDVKRQSDGSSSISSSSTASSSNSGDDDSSAAGKDVSTTTEAAPDLEALKESFGGGETAAEDADVQGSLPPKRPNGLYLLLDWNSFLEVGTSDDNRRVNLRFQPKIGDSRNFLPVSIP